NIWSCLNNAELPRSTSGAASTTQSCQDPTSAGAAVKRAERDPAGIQQGAVEPRTTPKRNVNSERTTEEPHRVRHPTSSHVEENRNRKGALCPQSSTGRGLVLWILCNTLTQWVEAVSSTWRCTNNSPHIRP
ncbi:unnamed protein product, partial [Pylaiella littoralis]